MNRILSLLGLFLLLGAASVSAQVKIGDNPTTINPNSVLEVESTNKGLLLPRLALDSTSSFAPLAAHVAGMIVYNTAISGTGTTGVTPGFYYNDGTQWVRTTPLSSNSTIINLGGGQYVFINEAGDSTTINVVGDIINNYQTVFGDTNVANYLDSTITQTFINNYETILGDTVVASYLDSLYGGTETITNLTNLGGGNYVYVNENGDSSYINVVGDVITNFGDIVSDTTVQNYLDSNIVQTVIDNYTTILGDTNVANYLDSTTTQTVINNYETILGDTVVANYLDSLYGGTETITNLTNLGGGNYVYVNENGDSSYINVVGDVITNFGDIVSDTTVQNYLDSNIVQTVIDNHTTIFGDTTVANYLDSNIVQTVINNYQTILGDTNVANYLDSTTTQTFINNYETILGDTVVANYLDSLYGGTETITNLVNNGDSSFTYINEAGDSVTISLANNKAWLTTGNAGTTPATGIGSPVGANNYWGTSDGQNLAVGTNGITRMIFDLRGNAYGGTNGSYVTPATANGGNNRNFIWGRSDSLVDPGGLGNSNSNAIFGAFNKVVSGGLLFGSTNVVGGGSNTVAASASGVFGLTNRDSASFALVAGGNNILAATAGSSVIGGGGFTPAEGNYLSGAYAAVFGRSNRDLASYSFVAGHNNGVGINGFGGVVFGDGNSVNASNAMAFGSQNVVSSTSGMAGGRQNVVAGDANFAFGYANQITAPTMWGSVTFGYENKIDGGYGNAIFGRNSTITNSLRAFTFGDHNLVTAGGEDAVFGANNEISNVQSAFVAGSGNKLTSGFDQLVMGTGNAITNPAALSVQPLLQIGRSYYANDQNALTIMKDARTAIGVDGQEAAAVPTELLDLGGDGTYGKSGLRIRNINTPAYIGNASTDKIVVADANGVLKTLSASALSAVDTTDWNLLGNAGTNEAVNFLGTNDGQNLVFKVNGVQAGLLSFFDGSPTHRRSTSFGVGALNPAQTGFNNTAIGFNAMAVNTTGEENASVGFFTLEKNTTGSYNAVLGGQTMHENTTGSGNVAIGHAALYHSVAGDNNIAIGRMAGNGQTAGNNNIFIGFNATGNISTTASNQLNLNNWIYGDNGKIGIGVAMPTNQLHVVAASNPLRLVGLQSGAATDSMLTVDASGVVRLRSFQSVNIYNSNGTLTGIRTVTTAGNALRFSNGNNRITIGTAGTQGIVLAAGSQRAAFQASGGSGGNANLLSMFTDSANAAQITVSGNATALNITTLTAIPIQFGTNNVSSHMTLDATGKLGINTGSAPLTSTLQVNGSIATSLRIVTADDTFGATDYTILKTGAAAATISLPPASSCPGRMYRLVEFAGDGNTSTLTISPAVQTYDGVSQYASANFWEIHTNLTAAGTNGASHSVTFQSDGTNWYALGR